MLMAKKKTGTAKTVSKPYLTGRPTDRRTLKQALRFAGMLIIMSILYLMAGAFAPPAAVVRVVINAAVLVLVYLLFWNFGVSTGTEDVTTGETLYMRREHQTVVTAEEEATCFHRLKGFIPPLLGTVPIFLCALVLAFIAQKVMYGVGPLPSWISNLSSRSEIYEPLAFYTEAHPLTLETVLRFLVRICLMPFVSMIGAENTGAMLTLERVSPLLVLLPALVHGIGYLRGPSVRSRMHSSIAANNRKRARREKKQRELRLKPKQEHLN